MAPKTKTRQITISVDKGAFSTLFRRFSGQKKDYDFEGLKALRNILSNEKARILHVIKTKSPKSIYELAKMLKRDFKSVKTDIDLLARFGFIEFISEKTGRRNRFKPIIIVDSLNIEIKV